MVARALGMSAAFIVLTIVASPVCLPAAGEDLRANIRQAEFRDKVFACWLGRALGGTLGQPLEGKHGPHEIPLTAKLSQGIANDEADLEILWPAGPLPAFDGQDGRPAVVRAVRVDRDGSRRRAIRQPTAP
jgi:hypothetical protein